jgi:predicted acetyltransferase/GrpB-like predicted nucleotidyltransferase (UPF0157 family)
MAARRTAGFAMKPPSAASSDKDPGRLSGADAAAHRAFAALERRRGAVASATIDEPVTVVAADSAWADWFAAEEARLRQAIAVRLVPAIAHIGSTSVSDLDAKPVVDIMLGIAAPDRIEDLLLRLEGLGYESLGIAGVPGRWALRHRAPDRSFNISVIAFDGNRWRENLAGRDYLRMSSAVRRRYAEAKHRAAAMAATLFAYSDAKRPIMETIVAEAKRAAAFRLVRPDLKALPEYVAALERGWSPDNLREAETAREELEKIRADPVRFVALLDDALAEGGPVTLPDGTVVPRLPGFRRWLWDGAFCGSTGFRWQPGTPDLPASYVLGHIGYAVVPRKRGRGYAKRALALILAEIRKTGLGYVELITDPQNIASQRVILANGGHLVERFREPAFARLLQRRHDDITAAYRERLAGQPTVEKKLQALAELRSAEGYMARLEERPGRGFLLIEDHCPICAAATVCQGFCSIELEAFRSLLGPAWTSRATTMSSAGGAAAPTG